MPQIILIRLSSMSRVGTRQSPSLTASICVIMILTVIQERQIRYRRLLSKRAPP